MLVLGIEKIKNKLSDQLTRNSGRGPAPWTIIRSAKHLSHLWDTNYVSSVGRAVTCVFAPVSPALELANPTLETTLSTICAKRSVSFWDNPSHFENDFQLQFHRRQSTLPRKVLILLDLQELAVSP